MPNSDCVFCKIIAGKIPSNKVYEDDDCIAIHDIMPKAPIHVLLVTKLHIASLAQLSEQDGTMIGRVMTKIPIIASKLGINTFPQQGYRLITNVGDIARQEIHHLHMHILGGKLLGDII